MATKPRIITVSVQRMNQHADWLAERGFTDQAKAHRAWAAELDGYDARETRKDPSKRRPSRAKK